MAMKRFYVQSSACVRLAGNLNSCFGVNTRLRKTCGLLPWLFRTYMLLEVKEVYKKRRGKYMTIFRHQREQSLWQLLLSPTVRAGSSVSEQRVGLSKRTCSSVRELEVGMNFEESKRMVVV